MNAFHPATIGALYGVLAKHEQALIQMALAANIAQADIDPEIAERYGAVVDDVKRLIALAEPSKGTSSVLESNEKMRRAYVLLGSLQAQLPEYDIWSWSVSYDEVGGNLRGDARGNDAVRANMHTIADRLGIEYVEKFHGSGSTTLIVCAKGKIDGIAVRIYDLIEAERPICDTHHVMVDTAGVCPQCPVADGEPADAPVGEYDPGDPGYEPDAEAERAPEQPGGGAR